MQSDRPDIGDGVVYTQTNAQDGNQIMTFGIRPNGTLTENGAIPTGGLGDGTPHLPSQGSVILSGDGRYVMVTNAGSGDLSILGTGEERPQPINTVTSGAVPRSVTESDGLVYALNTGEPSLSGFRIAADGLEPLAGSKRMLPDGADPAQVGFSPDGTTLVVTERGANAIATFPIDPDGMLGEARMVSSPGPTPYGFAFTSPHALVVVEAFGAAKGKAAVSSYLANGAELRPVSRSIGNGRSEICWAVVSADGHYVYTTNFGDSGLSRYEIGEDGTVSIDDPAAGVVGDGQPGLRDEDLTRDGRFLYALDADGQQIFGWSVRDQGALAPLGSWGSLPSSVAGLAAS